MEDPFPKIVARIIRQSPDLLYHYTSLDGLRGIMTNRILWATSIHHLNDTQELLHALNLASLAVQAYKPESLTTLQVELGMQMLEYIEKLKSLKLFIASFSEEGDLLSQWRAYCPREGGYSLGFSAPVVLSLAEPQGFSLYPCIYDREEQRDLIQFIVGSYLGLLQGIWVSAGRATRGLVESAAFYFVGALVRVAPLLKHPTFFEEREWRLVATIPPVGNSVKSRRAGDSVLPYREIRLAGRGSDSGTVIRKIVVGPATELQASVDVIRKVLGAEGMFESEVVVSASPFRAN